MKKFFALLCAGLIVLAGCGAQSSDSSSTSSAKVTIGLTYIPDTQFAPFYVAEKMGYFKDQGLTVTLRHHGAEEALMGALVAGDEDVVVAGGDEMMQSRSTGVDVVNWATMYQTYPVKLIVRADSGIASAKDLKGKTIGLPGEYGENYYVLKAMLAGNNLSESDVTVRYIGYTQATALASKQVDAVIGFSNSDAVSIESQGVAITQIDPVSGGLPLVGAGLGSLDGKVSVDTQVKILKALDEAVAYMKKDAEATLDIVATYVDSMSTDSVRQTAAKVLAASIELYGTGEFGAEDAATWEKMATFMNEAGLLTKPVTASEAMKAAR